MLRPEAACVATSGLRPWHSQPQATSVPLLSSSSPGHLASACFCYVSCPWQGSTFGVLLRHPYGLLFHLSSHTWSSSNKLEQKASNLLKLKTLPLWVITPLPSYLPTLWLSQPWESLACLQLLLPTSLSWQEPLSLPRSGLHYSLCLRDLGLYLLVPSLQSGYLATLLPDQALPNHPISVQLAPQ